MKIFSLPLIFLLFCFLFSGAVPGFAGQQDSSIFAEANSFFHQANSADDPKQTRQLYEKALLRYEQIARDVHNGRLYYNIGNTYVALDDIGRALVNYRRAEKLMPGDENITQNLAYVLSKRQDVIPAQQGEKLLQTLFFWHYDLSHHTRLLLFSGCYVLFWLAAGLMSFTPVPVSRWLTGSLLALSLLFATSLLFEQLAASPATGVIVTSEVVARQGDGRNYQPSFTAPLHAGTEFRLLEKRTNWLRVELNDGRKCWLPVQSCELV
ncbi:MAG: tetratricopeptide repeat protein [Proteobacteria bacterium]|nr:tetratricopeptide repeat protein [Pseudomonadota bacterium]MBU4294596.1 tetratricopeptide repeat protein [Pseudomonadota bacterium]MCG2747132.1 tetratricopeptide repeat protein [Desulfobulbaceae bacterium]